MEGLLQCFALLDNYISLNVYVECALRGEVSTGVYVILSCPCDRYGLTSEIERYSTALAFLGIGYT